MEFKTSLTATREERESWDNAAYAARLKMSVWIRKTLNDESGLTGPKAEARRAAEARAELDAAKPATSAAKGIGRPRKKPTWQEIRERPVCSILSPTLGYRRYTFPIAMGYNSREAHEAWDKAFTQWGEGGHYDKTIPAKDRQEIHQMPAWRNYERNAPRGAQTNFEKWLPDDPDYEPDPDNDGLPRPRVKSLDSNNEDDGE